MTTAIRDPRGRFQIGTMGGPGRPRRETEQGYLEILMQECTLDAWRTVVRKAVEAASEGDDRSRAWLSGYLVGQPTGKAPTTTSVVVAQMLGEDEALEIAARRLAKPELDREMWPVLTADTDRLRAIELEAQAVILAAEEAGADA